MLDFRQLHIVYNSDTDETFIEPGKTFLELEPITRADILQDAIAELTQLYNNTLKEMRNE
jgi:hypothetical protein